MTFNDRKKQLIDQLEYTREQLQAFVTDFGNDDEAGLWNWLEENDELFLDIVDELRSAE